MISPRIRLMAELRVSLPYRRSDARARDLVVQGVGRRAGEFSLNRELTSPDGFFPALIPLDRGEQNNRSRLFQLAWRRSRIRVSFDIPIAPASRRSNTSRCFITTAFPLCHIAITADNSRW